MKTAGCWYGCTTLLARTSRAAHSRSETDLPFSSGPSTRQSNLDDCSSLGAWQHLTVSAMALLVVFSLFLSWMGPMMDHHFAERHPGHQHIYLGAPDPGHRHDFRPSHSHDVFAALLPAAEQPRVDIAEGIVYVTPASGSGHGIADITVPASAQSIKFGLGDGSGLPGTYPHRDAIPTGASIAPSTRPPRA